MVMANTVAEARHTLTVPEQRLILWLVSQIEREDDCFKEFTLSVLDFEGILGAENNDGRRYSEIEAAVKRLQTRVLEVQNGPKRCLAFNWLHHAEYLTGEGKILLRLHDYLAPLLLQLRERFCQIPLRSLFRLRGGYAIRWLEMLHSRRHEGSFAMTVEELRDWLHIEPGELAAMGHLQSRAIDYPRKELERVSDFSFSYQPKKSGRKITGWTFTVLENKPKPVKKKKTSAARKNPPPAEENEEQRGQYVSGLQNLKTALVGGGASDSMQK